MLQKYFPILSEVNSPLATLVALQFSPEAAKIAVKGVSNETLETLLWGAVEDTAIYKKEVEVSISELKEARKGAAKALKAARYRATQAARSARVVSKVARRIKASKRPLVRNSHKGLKGLNLDICRSRAVASQAAVRTAANNFSAAHEAVTQAVEGGDVRTIRAAIAALKAAVRLLEVRHIEFKFAREMLSIALARHSA